MAWLGIERARNLYGRAVYAGDAEEPYQRLGEVTGQSEALPHLGVAAHAAGRRDDALAPDDEAHATALSCGAERILRQVVEARTRVSAPSDDHA
ncbi:hypothetical protein ACIBEJ_24705 [Nonomuraea sp. NPDC050790]|uniref:hypothetical protein n=1 Tax=Nonomuraea sp. NPDC050790 TaxID=3364371 RepID=UPI0037A219C4